MRLAPEAFAGTSPDLMETIPTGYPATGALLAMLGMPAFEPTG